MSESYSSDREAIEAAMTYIDQHWTAGSRSDIVLHHLSRVRPASSPAREVAMSARESCKWCARPIATDADYESIAEGEGRHLCWSEFGNDPDCEGVDGAEDIITNLRAQLAAVTAERDEARQERDQLGSDLLAAADRGETKPDESEYPKNIYQTVWSMYELEQAGIKWTWEEIDEEVRREEMAIAAFENQMRYGGATGNPPSSVFGRVSRAMQWYALRSRASEYASECYREEQQAHAKTQAERDALRAQVPRQCQWTRDEFDGSWDTACGEKHVFTCDGPSQNHHRFCPYCGGHLIEMATDETKGE